MDKKYVHGTHCLVDIRQGSNNALPKTPLLLSGPW
jgi:hypothetical protein